MAKKEIITYLVVQVLKSEGDLFALGNSGNTEIEPGAVIVAFQEGCAVSRDPEVIAVLVNAAYCLGEISGAELRAKHYFAVWDLPAGSLWEGLNQLGVIRRFEVQRLLCLV